MSQTTDLSKIIKGLECCQASMREEEPFAMCEECPYNDISLFVDCCRSVLCKDAVELMKKQEEVVHCKDCKYSIDYSATFRVRPYKCELHIFSREADWFCADGERR